MFSKNRTFLAALSFALLPCFVYGADEISFNENFSERVLAQGTNYVVVSGGTLEINISVPMKGPTNFNGASVLEFSIGDFHFSRSLSDAANYTDGARSFSFVQASTNTAAGFQTNHFDITWSPKLFTIKATTHDRFVIAKNYLNTTGTFRQVVSANISFGGVQIVNRPIYCNGKTTVLYKRVGSGDRAQEFALDFIQATGAADFTAPSVAVTSLVENARLTASDFPMSTNIWGTASDNVSVSQVLFRLNTGSPFLVASGTSNWIGSNIAPVPGTNTLYFKAIDLDGNTSPVGRRKFFYAVSDLLTISTNGLGIVMGLTNRQPLEIGRGYSVTALAKPGYLFADWSGLVTEPISAAKLQSPTLSFLMVSDGTLQANFVANPFPAVLGTYSGLFSKNFRVDLNTAGLLTFNLSASGAFSGRLTLKGEDYPVAGQFHPFGRALITVRRPSLPSLKLELFLDFAGGVSGTISESSRWTSQFTGYRRATASAPAKFTLSIPRSELSASSPGGSGFATMTLNSRGVLRVRGALADGTPFSQSTTVSSAGHWPLFASLYRGSGLVYGEMLFFNNPSYDVYGEDFIWLKTTNAPGRYYTNGFTLIGPVVGSTYFHGLALKWRNGSLEFDAGNLASPITSQVTVGPANKLIISSDNKTTLNLQSSGLLTGSFVHPTTGKKTLLRGVLLQKPQFGAGFFLGTNQSGYFMLQAEP